MVAGDRLLRDSNLELLRIVAMFLVLVVHADFLSLGRPTRVEIQSVPLASYTRFFIGSLSIVCVNVFILISGWFGIRPSVKSFSNFIFQCLFFSIGLYVVFILTGKNQFSLKGLAGCLFFKGYWFIYAYIGLYILAPILNAFVNTIKEGQIKLFLMVFFLFQTMYGWSSFASFFVGGYSTISFIGLYVLGRYLRLYTKAQIPPPILDYDLSVSIHHNNYSSSIHTFS